MIFCVSRAPSIVEYLGLDAHALCLKKVLSVLYHLIFYPADLELRPYAPQKDLPWP